MSAEEEAGARSQVVQRTCAILRALAGFGHGGGRLLDITRVTGLSRPTVHRILRSLADERFIQQLPSRRYRLGTAMFEIGMSAPSPVGDLEPFRRLVQKLADTCGDTVYFAIRRDDLAFYLLRCEGAYPVRTHVVDASHTLPLVGSHSGRALLAALGEDKAEEIIRRAEGTKLFGAATPDGLREEIDFVRRNGYGWARDVTILGVAGLTVPVPNVNGRPYLALTISSISQRLDRDRALALLPELQATARAIASTIELK